MKNNLIFPVESSTLYDMYFTEYEFSLTPEENQVTRMTIVMTIMIETVTTVMTMMTMTTGCLLRLLW